MMSHPVRLRLRLRLRALSIVVALCTAPAVRATPGVDQPPLAAPARPLVVPQAEEATLPNGVRVIVLPRHTLPLVTVALNLRLGSDAEPAGLAGLAQLTAQLGTRGALRGGRTESASQIASEAEALGGTLAAQADWGGSTTHLTVATTRLDAATALIADTVLHPTLAADEFERLRAQTADTLKLTLSDPMALAGLVARRTAWGAASDGAVMTPASLARITLADVQAFHAGALRPELATLVFSGDVTLERAQALASRDLGGWKAAAGPAPAVRRDAPSPRPPATWLVNLAGAGQSGVVVTAPLVAVDSPELRVAQVAAAVLGGGYSARLNAEVRIKRGLSYGASAIGELRPGGGLLFAATQTRHASAAEVAGLMRGEIVRLGQAAPTADELAARQAAMVGDFGRQVETTAGLADAALNLVEQGRPLSMLQQFAPEVLAVTPAQVADFAARHWTAAALRSVVVGDLAAAGADLKALDPQAQTVDSARLDLDSPGLGAR